MSKSALFLCTGNSCRSQLAEAIVKARMGGEWEACSAGTRPAGYVHPYALQALAEIGIRHEGWSKSPDEFRGRAFDLVVTISDFATEGCLVWFGKGKWAHLSVPDPAKVSGSDEETMAAFRAVRDAIAERIPALLEKQTESG